MDAEVRSDLLKTVALTPQLRELAVRAECLRLALGSREGEADVLLALGLARELEQDALERGVAATLPFQLALDLLRPVHGRRLTWPHLRATLWSVYDYLRGESEPATEDPSIGAATRPKRPTRQPPAGDRVTAGKTAA